ncbi:MAG: 5-methylcytosine-specific restriction endonuclease McrA [Acidimicrobiales bacterium]|jgi:5-methylcytosine-specific restriction endonuclease McrA
MSRALVLNATYEPIGVVSSRRAVVLALANKVDVLADTGTRLESEHLSVPVPSVVRLRYFVTVPYERHAPLNRRAVFTRDNGRCQYCQGPAESIDHIQPRSRGGKHEWMNVVACCRRCNSTKGDRLLDECSLRLRHSPTVPTKYSWVTVAVGSVPEAWNPYLGKRAA